MTRRNRALTTVCAASLLLAPAACSSSASSSPAADTPVDTKPTASLDDVLLTSAEAPGGGFVQKIDPATMKDRVDQLQQAQSQPAWDNPDCDTVARAESAANHMATDGHSEIVAYRAPSDPNTQFLYPISLVPGHLDKFLDRGMFAKCSSATRTDGSGTTMSVKVEDAPAVDAATGFLVTSDLVVPQPNGTKVIERTKSYHGYAKGTTVAVEYQVQGNDPAKDPVIPDAASTLSALYEAQMKKVAQAQ